MLTLNREQERHRKRSTSVSVIGWFQEVRDVRDVHKARVRNKASHEPSLTGVQSTALSGHTPVHTTVSSGFHTAPEPLPEDYATASTPHIGKLSPLREVGEVQRHRVASHTGICLTVCAGGYTSSPCPLCSCEPSS